MSIARGSTLENSYRYVTLAIDACKGKRPCGVMYHESRTAGIPFSGYTELARAAEDILQGESYPMRSVEQRTFREKSEMGIHFVRAATDSEEGEARNGRMATFRLYITHRYSASWQGSLIWQDRNQTYEYQSFLELMHIMNELISDMESVPVTDMSLLFKDTDELAEKLDMLFNAPDSETTSAIGFYQGKGGRATFVIRLLFRENATWQGNVCWREKGRKRSFRSFLELLLMIDAGIEDNIVWTQQKRLQAAL